MRIGSMFQHNDILGTAMQAAVVRNDVINNNIANADVPNYKKKAVKFETHLQNSLEHFERTGELNLSKAKPTIQIEHGAYSQRIDGNNVDIEKEMVDLYQNSVRYDTLTESVINQYKRIDLVLTSIK